MKVNKEFLWLILLLLFGLFLRIYGLLNPIIDMQYWRQTDTASITQNFYEEDFNIFYPRVNWRGSSEGLVESEFPLYQYSVALIYKLTGNANIVWGRVLSIFFSLLTGVFLFYFSKMLFKNSYISFYVTFFWLCSPISIFYGRAFMPDSMMISFYVLSVIMFHKWILSNQKKYLILTVIAFSVAILLKLTAIILLLPFALAYFFYGKNKVSILHFSVFILLTLIPAFFWYNHAHNLFQKTGLSFGIIANVGYYKFITSELAFSFKFWQKMLLNFFGTVLTPIGGTFLCFSIITQTFNRKKIKENILIFSWLFCVLVFAVIVGEAHRLLDYYWLHLLPVASIFIGKFMFFLEEKISIESNVKAKVIRLFMFFSILGVSFFFVKNYYNPSDFVLKKYLFSNKVKDQIKDEKLCIVIDTKANYKKNWYDKMNKRIHNPSFLFYLRKKGWEFLPHEFESLQKDVFLEYKKKGAGYFIVSKEIINKYLNVAELIKELNLKILSHDEHFVLYMI